MRRIFVHDCRGSLLTKAGRQIFNRRRRKALGNADASWDHFNNPWRGLHPGQLNASFVRLRCFIRAHKKAGRASGSIFLLKTTFY